MADAQAESTLASTRQAACTTVWRQLEAHRWLAATLLAGLLLRLVMATFPRFEFDTNLFAYYSERLASEPPWRFYDGNPRPFYTPGYLYVWWPLGELREIFGFNASQFQYILKLPPIAADLGAAALLYAMLEESRPLVRNGAAALYLFFPPVLFLSAVWGQTDSVLALAFLGSLYFISRGRPMAGALTFTVGFMIKPIAIAALPFLAVWIMRRHPPAVWVRITAASLGLTILLALPFFSYRVWEFFDQLQFMSTFDPNNSGFTYNFWQMFGFWRMGFRPDSVEEYGLATRYWGFILYGIAAVLIIAATWRRSGTGALALGTALSVLAYFLFATRMHERYGFSFLLLCLTAAASNRSWLFLAAFLGVGTINLANFYWAYGFFQPNSWLVVDEVYGWLLDGDALGLSRLLGFRLETGQLLSILIFAALPVLLITAYFRPDPAPSSEAPGGQSQ
jgi:hypothetical protein